MDAVLLETFGESGAKSGAPHAADDATFLIYPLLAEDEDILEGYHLTFHAGDLAHAGHAAAAVRQAL